ncbi:MAG TPA: hypothetical protein VNZ45_07540 [Bacteroidia bacterium]|jgi:hypothetical protein|nr:hypothetical protein [Bacteroidia bacterium]
MTFSENDNSYSLKVSPIISPEELTSGLWLVMAGVDDIPPHIALLNDGSYYSISAKKVDIGTPLGNFLKAISRRSVPALFIKILESSPQPTLRSPLPLFFEKYPTLGNGDHSCLWPIRDFFAKTFSEKYSKASLVFELLAMAEKDNSITECKSLFVESAVKGIVTLPKYTHEQIREKINSILKVNG